MVRDYSFILTLHNREPEVIMIVIRQIARSCPPNTEVVIVDDRSTEDYGFLKAWGAALFGDRFVWVTADPYDKFTIGDTGYGNPSRAFNLGLEAASGEVVFIVSSDTLVTPRLIQAATAADLSRAIYTPLVIDIESGFQYNGPMRLFPMPWFLAARREDCLAVGGWDEDYLDGISFEDNDFVGKLALKVGAFIGDWESACFHVSHYAPAYDTSKPEVVAAYKRNKALTIAKWNGIPFDGEIGAFEVHRRPDPSGGIYYVCKPNPDLLAKRIAETNSILKVKVDA